MEVAAGAGAVLGDAVGGDMAQRAGTAIGTGVGYYAATSGELPPVIVLTASPTKLYLMTSNNAKDIILARHLILIDTLERENLQVEMHQMLTTRTAVVTDNSTGLFHHMNDMLDTLAAADHADAENQPSVVADQV